VSGEGAIRAIAIHGKGRGGDTVTIEKKTENKKEKTTERMKI